VTVPSDSPARSRTAVVETSHADPALVASAVAPDNTEDVGTTVAADGAVRTRIRRPTTGGLAATLDDYLVNLTVAETVAHTPNHE